MIASNELTFDQVQAYLQRLIGQRDFRGDRQRVCVSASAEFGSEGFGVIRVTWQRPGKTQRDDTFYEFNSIAGLAWLVRSGRIPDVIPAE